MLMLMLDALVPTSDANKGFINKHVTAMIIVKLESW